MSSADDGVWFKPTPVSDLRRIAWPVRSSQDAWLVHDRNHSGLIDDGSEMFGNFTPFPPNYTPPAGVVKNGFVVLAAYDKPAHGGNGNGLIDSGDAIFRDLRLWHDRRRNGYTEFRELTTLAEANIEAIELDYKESRRVDQHGNQFRWRAKVIDDPRTSVGKWAWDVILTVSAAAPATTSSQGQTGLPTSAQ